MTFTTAGGLLSATLAAESGARLDRDLVLRRPVPTPEVGLSVDLHRPAGGRLDEGRAFGLLTIVPPAPERRAQPVARDLIVLLGEDPERAAFALRARTEVPLVTGLRIEGSALVAQAPARLPDLFAAHPPSRRSSSGPRAARLSSVAGRRRVRWWLACESDA